MATLSLIKEAITALKDRTGSSVIAINKYLETEKKVSLLLLSNRSFCLERIRVRTSDFGTF